MKWRMNALKIMLVLICIVNLGLGIMAFASKSMILKAIEIIYRVPLQTLPEYVLYIIKMLGCFLIALSVMTGFAVRNPYANRIVIYGNVIWLALRGIQRLTYIERFHQDWGISYAVLWANTIFVFLFALTLFLLIPKKSEA